MKDSLKTQQMKKYLINRNEKVIKDSGFQSTQLEYTKTAEKQTKIEVEILHGSTHCLTEMSEQM